MARGKHLLCRSKDLSSNAQNPSKAKHSTCVYDPGGPIVKAGAEAEESQEARRLASLECTVEKTRNSSQIRWKART